MKNDEHMSSSAPAHKKQPPQGSKQDYQQRLSFGSTGQSLNTMSTIPKLSISSRPSSVNPELERSRMLAQKTLQKSLKKNCFEQDTSSFQVPTRMDSTVNESDFLQITRDSLFNPELSSTPRASKETGRNDLTLHDVKIAANRMSEAFEGIIQKLESGSISIGDPFKEIPEDFFPPSMVSDNSQFIPAEEAKDKLLADELSWRQEKELPVQDVPFSPPKDEIKMSMGEFFQQKTEDIRNIIGGESPEKLYDPQPLLSESNLQSVILDDPKSKDSLSVTDIAHVLSDKRSTNTIVSYLLNHGKSKKESLSDKENESVEIPYDSRESTGGFKTPPLVSLDKSLSSLRSGSSLSNLPDGKLPIQSSKAELIWGCVRVGKCVVKEFTLRNNSHNRLNIQATITGQDFKLVKSKYEVEMQTSMKIYLRGTESKAISVAFCPSKLAAAVGSLVFTPCDLELQQTKKQLIHLFGYGGHASLHVCDVTKDTAGKLWLSLGNLQQTTDLKASFTIQNTGVLPGFVNTDVISSSVILKPCVSVVPSRFVVKPQERTVVEVFYTPSKEDLIYFSKTSIKDIVELGIVKLTLGEECSRGRLNKLSEKAQQSNLEVIPIEEQLQKEFQNECIPSDLRFIKESVAAAKELRRELVYKEIILTLDCDNEQTLIADDSSNFFTLCRDDTANLTVVDVETHASLKIEPAAIILTPPIKFEDTLLVTCVSPHYTVFEASVTPKEHLTVTPAIKTMAPNETVLVRVSCRKEIEKDLEQFKIKFVTSNDVLEVDVKVVCIKNFK